MNQCKKEAPSPSVENSNSPSVENSKIWLNFFKENKIMAISLFNKIGYAIIAFSAASGLAFTAYFIKTFL
jgi:hypothetical protein